MVLNSVRLFGSAKQIVLALPFSSAGRDSVLVRIGALHMADLVCAILLIIFPT